MPISCAGCVIERSGELRVVAVCVANIIHRYREAKSSIDKTGQSLYFASGGGSESSSDELSGIGLHVIPKACFSLRVCL